LTTEENKKKKRIMEYAFQNFITLGISQITMDQIARGVGMGKGTLYKYFPSKEILILDTIDFVAEQIDNSIKSILEDEKMTMTQKLNLFVKTIAQRLSKINPNILEYMKRSIPEAYEKIEHTRERIILNNLVRLFEDGKKCSFFVPDIDALLVSHMMIGAVNHIVNTHILMNTDYTFDKLFTSLVTILLNGCLTEEGRKSQTLSTEN
jgi:AcrR family transcriptional regulator